MQAFKTKNKRSFSRKGSSFRGKRKEKETRPLEKRPPALQGDAGRLLADIGKPEPTPFTPDPFQVESLDRILREDVVVSAPTGSGKTWIALEATKKYLSRGSGIWYATPLKALSNAKYGEFGEALGTNMVGILTGDRKENSDAPVIVGTTEILRNQLYDAMHAGLDLDIDLVILDEPIIWAISTEVWSGRKSSSTCLPASGFCFCPQLFRTQGPLRAGSRISVALSVQSSIRTSDPFPCTCFSEPWRAI